MGNLYVGTGSSQSTRDVNDALRSGYDKKAANTSVSSLPTGAAVKSGLGITGNGWGSFTGCGGMIAKTANEVFLLHSAPGGATFSNQWKDANSWIQTNKDLITQAIFIGFGSNANPPVFKTIHQYLTGRAATPTQPKAEVVLIQRKGSTSIKASATLDEVSVVSGARMTALLSSRWDSVSGGSVTQS